VKNNPSDVVSLTAYWYRPNLLSRVLQPLSWLFCALASLRRQAYRQGWLRTHRLPVPVIVVGNVTVGGTGKTPLVAWLAEHLARRGRRPGIVSRGYGGRAREWPRPVTADSDPSLVGDEPLLLARRIGCPLWVGPDRVAAARALLAHAPCDIIVSDDGMQHYALARDLEIAVIDGDRREGNGRCLPAGPLREPRSRLQQVDLRVCNGPNPAEQEFAMRLEPQGLVNLRDPRCRQDLAAWGGREVIAVAGIGNPQRFFALLRSFGMTVEEKPFPDHHAYRRQDLPAGDPRPLIMTEKDAVKCRRFARPNDWFVPVRAQLDAAFTDRLEQLLGRIAYG
jgi:tetraacyldisaccharide 4'-kinase